jgi:hypothetical protein
MAALQIRAIARLWLWFAPCLGQKSIIFILFRRLWGKALVFSLAAVCITAVNALLAIFVLFADQGLGPRQMHLTDIASHYFRDTGALPGRAARAGTGRFIAFGLPVMAPEPENHQHEGCDQQVFHACLKMTSSTKREPA